MKTIPILLAFIICASCANLNNSAKNEEEAATNEEEAATAFITTQNPDPCYSYPCSGGGKCEKDGAKYKCYCQRNYTGDNCEIAPNPCCPNPCKNGGSCANYYGKYVCHCPKSRMGYTCETVNHCGSEPCQNGGTCRSGNGTFECKCTINYEGKDCSQSIWCNKYGQDLCNKKKCQYNETIERGYCVCENGNVFHEPSKTCTDDHCASNPCQNGGICINGKDNFECTCTDIYGGKYCSENIWCDKYGQDLCGKEICQYNENLGRGYCVCKNGEVFYEPSKTCMEGACSTHHCHNGGICKDDGDGPTCYCKFPFSGERCDSVPDPCSSNPCKSNERCTNEDGKYKCICKDGYSGDECEADSNPCLPNPCKNNGLCANMDGKAKCFCKYGYTGDECEIEYRYMISSVIVLVLLAAICFCSGCCLFRMTQRFVRDAVGYKTLQNMT